MFRKRFLDPKKAQIVDGVDRTRGQQVLNTRIPLLLEDGSMEAALLSRERTELQWATIGSNNHCQNIQKLRGKAFLREYRGKG